ncbi:MAG: stage IV sporulation protein A [Firmicutes bacterium]|nr:stage IV sporulation protein A [Bacillota bacterium]
MAEHSLYHDIARRTGGDIYLGVVGPVRSGKSTFIKKFMELLVIPNITNEQDKMRAVDELPQSSGGKTITTTEPKFIPDEAVEVRFDEDFTMRVRLVDCVGYTVESALGYQDERGERLVISPWAEEEIPFQQAAEIGTRKVIADHSTLGLVITTDGSFSELPRDEYQPSEERVIEELKAIGKPFVVILNSNNPDSQQCQQLREELTGIYGAPVIACNCLRLDRKSVDLILREALYEFPVNQANILMPDWVEVLDEDHWLKTGYTEIITNILGTLGKVRDLRCTLEPITEQFEFVNRVSITGSDLGTGEVEITMESPTDLFYSVLTETTGYDVKNAGELFAQMRNLAVAKREYDKIEEALVDVKSQGYGIVPPSLEEMTLDEPEIIRQGSRFGVRLRASAPAIHMIRVDVESEFAPIVGTEKQSEDLVNYILDEFEDNPEKIWESDIFGKSLHSVVKDGIQSKLSNLPPSAQAKLQETLEKIINEGNGGLIAIIL